MKTRLLLLISITCVLHNAGAQVGNVGINTTTPLALLHVNDSSVLFTGPSELTGNPGPPPVSGAGNRMMWYADKAAFRSGGVYSTTWDRDSIGHFSFASGFNSLASGQGSVALGSHTRAKGYNAFAAGDGTLASGGTTTSLGYYTSATGTSSTAMGSFSRATAYGSLAAGWDTKATADEAFALNTKTIANGNSSTSLGYGTIANGTSTLAIGSFNDPIISAAGNGLYTLHPWTPLLIIGNGTSFLERQNALVVRYDGKTGIGTNSPDHILEVADPQIDTQIAKFRSSGGYGEIVVGNGSKDVDLGTNDNWGYVGTKSNANFTLRTGAVSRMSFVHNTGFGGIGTTSPQAKLHVRDTSGSAQVAIFNTNGLYSKIFVGNAIATVDLGIGWSTGYVGTTAGHNFSIHTGENHVLFCEHETSNVGIGTTEPESRLHINKYATNQIIAKFTNNGGYGEVNVANGTGLVDFGVSSTDGYIGTKTIGDFYIRTAGLAHFVVKQTTGNVGIGISYPSAKLEVNGTAMKPGGGSWTATSDIRLKQNINSYTVGLEEVLAIRPVSYQYNSLSGMSTDETYVGVIAQELQKIAPDMVSVSQKIYEDGTTGYLQVDNSAMTYMLINAVKELSARVDAQQQVIDGLLYQLEAKGSKPGSE